MRSLEDGKSMSAKNRGAVTIEKCFYPTPDYTINSILSEIDFTKVKSFREPCRGGGVYSIR